jgi:ABC-type branched-subunit amino acid transport system ATPase component
VHLALRYVDRGYVLRRGEVVLQGTAAELTEQRDRLDEAYLGAAMRGSA